MFGDQFLHYLRMGQLTDIGGENEGLHPPFVKSRMNVLRRYENIYHYFSIKYSLKTLDGRKLKKA